MAATAANGSVSSSESKPLKEPQQCNEKESSVKTNNHKNGYTNSNLHKHEVMTDNDAPIELRRGLARTRLKRRRVQTPSPSLWRRSRKIRKPAPFATWCVEDVQQPAERAAPEPVPHPEQRETTEQMMTDNDAPIEIRRGRARTRLKRRRVQTPSPSLWRRSRKIRKPAPFATWCVEDVQQPAERAAPEPVPHPEQRETTEQSVRAPPIPPLDWSALGAAQESFEKCSLVTALVTQLSFYLLIFLSYLNQLLFPPKVATERNREGYAPLYNPFDLLFLRYMYRRVRHCFNRPVCSTPEAEITLKERATDDYNWTFRLSGRKLKCVNLGSYNYLGYRGGARDVEAAARRYGLSLASSRAELGSCPLHEQLETELADFLGVEAAVVVGMGFATNSLMLPGLLAPGALVLSDENNHASLIVGLRLARVVVRVFRHNDMRHLEQLARQARAEGRWTKIVIVMEGVYSMEGSMADLQAAVALKRRLGLQLYLDEAHSVGATGATGRGATDACGVDPKDIDVLMGTFTKSFRAAGGYIAGSAALVKWVRLHGHAPAYAHSMAPPVCAQVLAALRDLRAPSGQARVAALRGNTRYFRDRLRAMGVVTYGHPNSPVVPMMVYSFSKMAACVERLTARGVASVGVGFPATPLHMARIRFCLSAAHTREQLDKALAAIEAAADELGLRYSRLPPPPPQAR